MVAIDRKTFLQRWGPTIVLVLLVALVFSPIIYKVIYTYHFDYDSHIYWAEQIFHPTDSDNVPLALWAHSNWHFLVILFSFITFGSFPVAGSLATVFSIILLSVVTFQLIRPVLLQKNISLWWGVAVALGMTLVAPIYLYVIKDKQFYFGYLGLTSYHNPTIILLKPLAILVFIWGMRCFQPAARNGRQVLIAAVFSILATLTKPSFAICFIPALGLGVLWYLFRKKPLDWKMIIFGFILPTSLVLIWQFWLTYASNDPSSIELAPFGVMNIRSGWLDRKFLLSIGFPLLIMVLYWKDALKDTRLLLAWTTLFFGSFFTYFLAEQGPRFAHGNFVWSGEIAMLVLFSMSTLFFIEKARENRYKTILVGLVWGLHVLCGVGYYLHLYLTGIYV